MPRRPTRGGLTREKAVFACVFPLGHLRLRPPARQSTGCGSLRRQAADMKGWLGVSRDPGPSNRETSLATAPESCSIRVEQGSGCSRVRRVGRCHADVTQSMHWFGFNKSAKGHPSDQSTYSVGVK
jgi:hypothetical protein